jgi:hypothetical protein
VKDNGAGLVVKDSDCRQRITVIRPSDVASLWTLQPFEADHRGGGRFGVSSLDR